MTAAHVRFIERFLPHRLLAFLEDCRGAVLIELAFALPITLIIVLGCYDATRFVLINQKMDRAAATMADLVSRPNDITETDLNLMFYAADEILRPFNLYQDGRVIVTSIARDPGESARIVWQRTDDSTYAASSNIGTAGGSPNLPEGFTVRENETLIVAEVFFQFQPRFVDSLFPGRTVTQTSYRRPRLGKLTTVH